MSTRRNAGTFLTPFKGHPRWPFGETVSGGSNVERICFLSFGADGLTTTPSQQDPNLHARAARQVRGEGRL